MKDILLAMSICAAAANAFAAGHGGGRGGPGGRPGNKDDEQQRPMRRDSAINLESYGWIDAMQAQKLAEQLKTAIQRHNAQLLRTYDKNNNGKIDANEEQAIKSAQRSLRPEPGSRGGNGGAMGPPPDGGNGGGMGPPPDGNGGGMGPPPDGGNDTSSTSKPTAVYAVSGKSASKENTSLAAQKPDESAVYATDGASLALRNVKLTKTGDTSSESASNFAGLNAVVLASGTAKITLEGGTLESNGNGANGLFAAGKQAVVHAKNLTIKTTANSSRGLDATKQGTIVGENLVIETQGAHCACLATDRGEGTVTVSDIKGTAKGEGSPGIYSTGAISATHSRFEAFGSEAAVIEGKNSISLTDCDMTGHRRCGVMLYQSFSGDADVGKSAFTMTGGSLTAKTGPLFQVNNTQTEISLKQVKLESAEPVFLEAKALRWGKTGHNGGHVAVTLQNQKAGGDVMADEISTVAMTLDEGAEYTGTVNAAHTAKEMSVTLKKGAAWNVTGDSYLTRLDFAGAAPESALACIHANGHTVYAANLNRDFPLPGGGWLKKTK